MRVVALMGSYREGGTIDTIVDEVLEGARAAGASTEKIDLIEQRVEFCRNCRACTRAPGPERVPCAEHDDDVDALLARLEAADAIVLAAPVNFGDVNAVTRRLLERMVGYGYWPEGQAAPKLRRRTGQPALLVSSSAAPGWMTRLFARPLKTLRHMARTMGARPVGSLVLGLMGAGGRAPGRGGVAPCPAGGRRARAPGRTRSRDLPVTPAHPHRSYASSGSRTTEGRAP